MDRVPTLGRVETPLSYGAVAPDADIWPLNERKEHHYAVNTMYPTIQGEGRLAGTPMLLLRLQGCPVGCVFCDTPETWKRPIHFTHVDEIKRRVEVAVSGTAITWALITGGEPCWHDIGALACELRSLDLRVAVETSGVFPISIEADWLTVSPKPKGKLNLLRSTLRKADEVKWVVGKESDVADFAAFALDLFRDIGQAGGKQPVLSVQPISQSLQATNICVAACLEYGWRLSIQQHKYLQIA